MKKLLKYVLLIIFLAIYSMIIKEPNKNIYNINIIKKDTTNLVDNFKRLDYNYWTVVESGNNPNNELQFFTNNNVHINNDLIITAQKNNLNNHNYTSGMINTKGKFEFMYGTIIFRAKVASGNGLLSAIWLLPSSGNNLPEIDLLEVLGQKPNELWIGMHYLNNNVKDKYFTTNNINSGYFLYEFRWKKDSIECYVDGKLLYMTTSNIPQEKMYLIINLSVGGNWPGKVNDDMLPSSLILDYIAIIPEDDIK